MTVQRLTRRQAAVVSAFTGFLAGPFEDLQELAEELTGGPVWTHEFGSKEFSGRLSALARPLFLEICATAEGAS